METITVHSYDWETGTDNNTGYTTINCWGLNRDSKPYLLRFHDFDVFCYLELPKFLDNRFVRWEGEKHKLVYHTLCEKLEEDRPYRYKFEMKEKYYYYKGENKYYPMILLCFRSISSMKTCLNKFISCINDARYVLMFCFQSSMYFLIFQPFIQ